jgi:hypothetical protein
MSIKGQAFTYDFFIALGIFFAILSILSTYWYYYTLQFSEIEEKNEAFNSLVKASQIWFSEGYPVYWDLNNIVEIGLSNEGRINSTKLSFLENLNETEFLKKLNFGNYRVKYEVYEDSKLIFSYPNSSFWASEILTLERFGVLNGSIVKIKTYLWKP